MSQSDEILADILKVATALKMGAVYYHGSGTSLKVGTILKPGRGIGMQTGTSGQQFVAYEKVFEELRPSNRLSRQNCIFMCGSPEDVGRAGGSSAYLYQVQPAGQVDKSDQAWYGSLDFENLNPQDPQVQKIVSNYWNGVQHPTESLWEYRAASAKIIKQIPYSRW